MPQSARPNPEKPTTLNGLVKYANERGISALALETSGQSESKLSFVWHAGDLLQTLVRLETAFKNQTEEATQGFSLTNGDAEKATRFVAPTILTVDYKGRFTSAALGTALHFIDSTYPQV